MKPLQPSESLFSDQSSAPSEESLGEGAVLFRGWATNSVELLAAVAEVTAVSPFRHLITPGGFRMSVAMTNCGRVGWISDRKGYRYGAVDPQTEKPWPALPDCFRELAERSAAAAGFGTFDPDACLINRYEPGAKLSLHQDADEGDLTAPIVSVSLGLPATFLWGGLQRSDKTRKIRLEHGDVVVWGGPSRLVYHGVNALKDGEHPETGRARINITFRKAL